MIDPLVDEILTLREAAKRLPRCRNGRPLHVATLYRWVTRGLRGTRLETIRIGGSRCTSTEALQRFFNALSNKSTSTTVNTNVRARQIAAAEEELQDFGL
ncbi:MAG: DUF1580 domain-containing protein [Planctomycetes bacterium]|nr:DUF1580 domain-containing protein [Planctomycetota bacterium]